MSDMCNTGIKCLFLLDLAPTPEEIRHSIKYFYCIITEQGSVLRHCVPISQGRIPVYTHQIECLNDCKSGGMKYICKEKKGRNRHNKRNVQDSEKLDIKIL